MDGLADARLSRLDKGEDRRIAQELTASTPRRGAVRLTVAELSGPTSREESPMPQRLLGPLRVLKSVCAGSPSTRTSSRPAETPIDCAPPKPLYRTKQEDQQRCQGANQTMRHWNNHKWPE
jgi:hypothetical protein